MAHCQQLGKEPKPKLQIPKSVHRVIEVPAKQGHVYSHPVACSCCYANPMQKRTASCKPKCERPKPERRSYTQPTLNTALKKVHQLNAIGNMQCPTQYKTSGDLTPRSKAVIAPKITQKLNFHADNRAYRNLPSINVNDSILCPNRKRSISKKYVKTYNKIPAPELCDFLDPIPPLTLKIAEPDLTVVFPNCKIQFSTRYIKEDENDFL